MNKPLYLLQLNKEAINGDSVCCTGEQLQLIMKHFGKSLKWYAADIDNNNEGLVFQACRGPIPRELGVFQNFSDEIGKVTQFLSGIFLGVPSTITFPQWNGRHFETEDQQFKTFGDALIEIRTFDTSYFEIYAKDRHLLEQIASVFGGDIITGIPSS